jgi:hypothetical protein
VSYDDWRFKVSHATADERSIEVHTEFGCEVARLIGEDAFLR